MAGENVCASDFEPHSTASHDSRHEITPGLIGLNLNIMQALDMNIIQDVKENISKLINKEHDIVRNVHENIISLLKMKIPREKREGRQDLESILTRSSNNLNVLADLEYVYGELHRSADADKCKRTIEKIMRSEKENDMQCKQTCLLEQGYVILIERTLFNINTVKQRITDLTKILNTEQKRSKGIRKECLGRGLHHQMQVLRNVQNANEEDSKDGHILRKGSSLQKFQRAEQMFTTPFPHIVWEYYHAKAYYYTLEVMSRFKKGLEEEMTNVTISAVEKFWEISQSSTDQDMKSYKARSYAYIGQILIRPSRSKLVRSKEMEFSFLKTEAFRKYLEDPLKASKTAFDIQPNDITVLTRYGRRLWNISESIEDSSEKLKWLQKADSVLSKAIDNDNHHNWFALSTRMLVRLDISDIYVKTLDAENNRSANRYLHKAIEDGLKCFQSQTTQMDMTFLADAYQRLAKFPNTHKYGKEYVKTPDHLHQALDYLSFATHLGAPPDYHWTHRTASCLFDLGNTIMLLNFKERHGFLLHLQHRLHSTYSAYSC